jgi:hypothetical protein
VPQAKKKTVSPKQAAARKVADKKKIKDAAAKVRAERERAQEDARSLDVTSAEAWLADTPEPVGTKVLLPSGKVCLAYNPGIEVFVQAGAIPNPLMPAVMKAIKTGKGIDPEEAEAIAEDADMLAEILNFADVACIKCVLEPKVAPVPEDGKRKAGVLYVDRVDYQDKMFLLQWMIGGVKDLDRFRVESAAALGVVEQVQDVADTTE